jgi:signal transduction histidine kinase
LEAAVRDFQGQAAAKGIALRLIAPSVALRTLVIEADEAQLGEALENLLSNALKYTPPGGAVTVSLEQGGPEVLIHVRDTGIGVPADDLPRLFERFYRVNSAAHRAQEGTGLGLSIVKVIMERHGGAVRAVSAPGAGSLFTLALPFPEGVFTAR